jgi:hypothetical protein
MVMPRTQVARADQELIDHAASHGATVTARQIE